ncbi:vps53-like domain protein, partial [Trypanosoma cruzi]
TSQSAAGSNGISSGIKISNIFSPTTANTYEHPSTGGLSNAFSNLVGRAGSNGNASTTTMPTAGATSAATAEESFGSRFAKAARSTVTTMNFLSNFKKEGGNTGSGAYGPLR